MKLLLRFNALTLKTKIIVAILFTTAIIAVGVSSFSSLELFKGQVGTNTSGSLSITGEKSVDSNIVLLEPGGGTKSEVSLTLKHNWTGSNEKYVQFKIRKKGTSTWIPMNDPGSITKQSLNDLKVYFCGLKLSSQYLNTNSQTCYLQLNNSILNNSFIQDLYLFPAESYDEFEISYDLYNKNSDNTVGSKFSSGNGTVSLKIGKTKPAITSVDTFTTDSTSDSNETYKYIHVNTDKLSACYAYLEITNNSQVNHFFINGMTSDSTGDIKNFSTFSTLPRSKAKFSTSHIINIPKLSAEFQGDTRKIIVNCLGFFQPYNTAPGSKDFTLGDTYFMPDTDTNQACPTKDEISSLITAGNKIIDDHNNGKLWRTAEGAELITVGLPVLAFNNILLKYVLDLEPTKANLAKYGLAVKDGNYHQYINFFYAIFNSNFTSCSDLTPPPVIPITITTPVLPKTINFDTSGITNNTITINEKLSNGSSNNKQTVKVKLSSNLTTTGQQLKVKLDALPTSTAKKGIDYKITNDEQTLTTTTTDTINFEIEILDNTHYKGDRVLELEISNYSSNVKLHPSYKPLTIVIKEDEKPITVTSLTPSFGLVSSTNVTITGTNFSQLLGSDSNDGKITVAFGGKTTNYAGTALGIFAADTGTDTGTDTGEITVTVPAGAKTGRVYIKDPDVSATHYIDTEFDFTVGAAAGEVQDPNDSPSQSTPNPNDSSNPSNPNPVPPADVAKFLTFSTPAINNASGFTATTDSTVTPNKKVFTANTAYLVDRKQLSQAQPFVFYANSTGKFTARIMSKLPSESAFTPESTIHIKKSATEDFQEIPANTSSTNPIRLSWDKSCQTTTNCSTLNGRQYFAVIETDLVVPATTSNPPVSASTESLRYFIPLSIQNPFLSTIITSCSSNVNVGAKIVCTGRVPDSLTGFTDLKIKIKGTTTNPVACTIKSNKEVECDITAPLTAGNYVVVASSTSTTPAITEEDVASVSVSDFSKLVSVQATKEVRAGEDATVRINLDKDAEYISITARVKGPNGYSQNIFFRCHKSLTAFECGEELEAKITDDNFIISWKTDEVRPGLYTVVVFARTQNEGSAATASTDIRVLPGTCSTYFIDIDQRSPYCAALEYVRLNGLFYGKNSNDGKFADLNKPLIRAEFFALASRLYQKEGSASIKSTFSYGRKLQNFRDISEQVLNNPANQFWLDAIASLDGIVQGYGDGTLRPGRQLTMAELAKVVGLATNFIGYYDQNQSPWYADIVDQYYFAGIKFDPEDIATRGDAVMLMYETVKLAQDRYYFDSGYTQFMPQNRNLNFYETLNQRASGLSQVEYQKLGEMDISNMIRF